VAVAPRVERRVQEVRLLFQVRQVVPVGRRPAEPVVPVEKATSMITTVELGVT